MIVCDRQMRVYIVLSDDGDAVRFVERGNNGPDEIRRATGESGDSIIAIRRMPSERFHELFFSLNGYTQKSTGDVAKSFLGGPWTMDRRTRYELERIVYLEDMIEYIKAQKQARAEKAGVALARARMVREKADRDYEERQARIEAKRAKRERMERKERKKKRSKR